MTAETYRSLAAPHTHEIEVKRSRFVAFLAPVVSEEEARVAIEVVHRDHPKARHHCTAFVLGPAGQTRRSNDDGEPSGTAGAPMLEVLTGHELTDVVAVVTRYFGGTLLGAGGLIRAYGGAVSAALEGATTRTFRRLVPIRVALDYARAAAVEARARALGWELADADYGAHVTLTLGVPPSAVDEARRMLADASAGEATPEVLPAGYVPLRAETPGP